MKPIDVIDALGGYKPAASVCGIMASAVYKWKRNGVPTKHIKLIMGATGLTFEDIHKATQAAKKEACSRKRASKTEHISQPVSRLMERLENG